MFRTATISRLLLRVRQSQCRRPPPGAGAAAGGAAAGGAAAGGAAAAAASAVSGSGPFASVLRGFGVSLATSAVNYIWHQKRTHQLLEEMLSELRASPVSPGQAASPSPSAPAPAPKQSPPDPLPSHAGPLPPHRLPVLRLVFPDFFIEVNSSLLTELRRASPVSPGQPATPSPSAPAPAPKQSPPDPLPSHSGPLPPRRLPVLRLVFPDFFIEVGGPFYTPETGMRNITLSFSGVASNVLPNFALRLRGFNERETVSLLGAHSIGTVQCRSCLNHKSPSQSSSSAGDLVSPPSPQVPGVEMDYEGKGSCFSTLYYRSLLQGRGILYVDLQLTVGEQTECWECWVRAYCSDASLSTLGVLIAPVGQVRISCSKTV